jgi:hypothetical protein
MATYPSLKGGFLRVVKKGILHGVLLSPAPLATSQDFGVVKNLSIRREASESQKYSKYLRKCFL